MRSGLLVLTLLVGLASVGYSKNGHVLNKVQQRMMSLSHKAKRLFVKGDSKHALWQQLAVGTGLAILACTNIGCGGGAALRGVTQEQQYVRSPEEIMGRHVHFFSEGKDYVGYVADALDSDEVSIDLYDGSIMDIKTHQVRGLQIELHHDEGRQVVLASREEGQQFLHAFVVTVYDSNYYELMVGAYVDYVGNLHVMDHPYVIITHFDNIVSIFGEPID